MKGWLGFGYSKFCQIDSNESEVFGYFHFFYHDYNDVFWNYRLMQVKQTVSRMVITWNDEFKLFYPRTYKIVGYIDKCLPAC